MTGSTHLQQKPRHPSIAHVEIAVGLGHSKKMAVLSSIGCSDQVHDGSSAAAPTDSHCAGQITPVLPSRREWSSPSQTFNLESRGTFGRSARASPEQGFRDKSPWSRGHGGPVHHESDRNSRATSPGISIRLDEC